MLSGMERNLRYAAHLQKMVCIPAVSNADPDALNLDAFFKLHRVLEEMYPLVHQRMTRKVIGKCALLYHLSAKRTFSAGSKASALAGNERAAAPAGNERAATACNGVLMGKDPLMFIAHQDVVPAGDPGQWKYPPYAAEIHDGLIYGRGTTDSKCNIQAYMDALEELLEEGFEPDYDLYFGFGYNEESGSPEPAARLIADELKRRGVQMGMILDECGGIFSDHATIYTCEKGYVDLEISVSGKGGHSARPFAGSPVAKIAEAILAIEQHPMPFRMTETVRQELAMKPGLTEKKEEYYALTHSTAITTIVQAGELANVIPAKASAVVNCRLLPGETVEELIAYMKSILPEGIDVRLIQGNDAPPESKIGTSGYKKIEEVIGEMYPGMPLIPEMLLGGTDSRYYSDVCPSGSIYRFTGLSCDPRWENTSHLVDERIPVDILAANVDFYKRLMQAY